MEGKTCWVIFFLRISQQIGMEIYVVLKQFKLEHPYTTVQWELLNCCFADCRQSISTLTCIQMFMGQYFFKLTDDKYHTTFHFDTSMNGIDLYGKATEEQESKQFYAS